MREFPKAGAVNGWLRRVPVWALWLAGLVPLALVVWQALAGDLGPDPVRRLEGALGERALQFLIATLAVTPLRRFTGISLLKFRRTLGLLAFTYAALHLTVWVTLDLQFRWGEIAADLTKRRFIIVGMAAFLVMVPLAVTSNAASIRRMGAPAWRRMHRLTYVAGIAGALHVVLLSKVWVGDSLVYAGLIAGLLAVRMLPDARPGAARKHATT